MLTRYRLINVTGLASLMTSIGTFRIDQISDEVAEQLAAQGSRYVEPVALPAPETAAATVPVLAAEAPPAAPAKPAAKRRKSS